MKKIKFGTDGWRGIIADDFTFENLRVVSQGVADYINNLGMGARGIVVGYDNRFLSNRFADTVADVMIQNGIDVYLSDQPLPTPVTAFAVKAHDAAGAVMITASHNPPEYNGFKFIPDYAGPALPHITDAIEANIAALQKSISQTPWPDMEPAAELAIAKKHRIAQRILIDPRPDYFDHLEQLVDLAAIGRANLEVMVDAMHGSGIGYLDTMFDRAGKLVQKCRCYRDPLFGGGMPEPTGELLDDVCQWIVQEKGQEGAKLGLALDGDADRFGLIDSGGVYFNPNRFLPILYHHLITAKGMLGPVTRTVATTHMLDRIARYHGQKVYETAVGFKYIGQNLMEKGCVLGGEESGGLSIKGHIPEKDGILAGLLAAEMVALHGKSLAQLEEEMCRIYNGLMHSNRLDVKTAPGRKQQVLERLRTFAPAELAGRRVVERNTVDGVKIILESDEWVLVRPSGTEPLFRIYAESLQEERVPEIQNAIMAMVGLS